MQMTGVAHHEAFLARLQSTYVDCRCAQVGCRSRCRYRDTRSCLDIGKAG
jgi:hypothetical protein